MIGCSFEVRLLLALGIRKQVVDVAEQIAAARRTSIADELIRLGYLPPDLWWQTIARTLQVRYFPSVVLEDKAFNARLPDARSFYCIRQVMHRTSDSGVLIVAPRGAELDQLNRDIALDPDMRRRIAIASPRAIRLAVRRAFEPPMTYQATTTLRLKTPDMSAANANALIRRIIGCLAIMVILALLAPLQTLAIFNLFFLAAGAIRLAASRQRPAQPAPMDETDADLPQYVVLVPLYREARMIGDLIKALQRLDYPRHKLAIHLVVEADDRQTLSAALRATERTSIQVIAVPPSHPRTKPKALVWSLPLIAGDLLTVFDAEDRPEPDQLRKAAAAFADAPPDLACVQAVLDTDHARPSNHWLVRQFTMEYRALFRTLLPWLAHHSLFLPIGGTSNHFRLSALRAVGAWDPFNVTEDADLSVRLYRAGWRIGVIASVTSEEAPVTWRAWHLQRTRWMKGWLQTWLVHTRHPIRLWRDLGPVNFCMFQVLILGQILSVFGYPFGVALIGVHLAGLEPLFGDRSFADDLMLALDLAAFSCGWLGAVSAITARRGTSGAKLRIFDLLTLPLYWFLLFAAAVAAVAELIVDPHYWNKTRHGHAKRETASPIANPANPR